MPLLRRIKVKAHFPLISSVSHLKPFMYFYHKKKTEKEKCHLISKDLIINQLISYLCRQKERKGQELNLGEIENLLQPIQRLVRSQLVFYIYLKESTQLSLVNHLMYHFVLVLTSHLNASLCQTLLICQGKPPPTS